MVGIIIILIHCYMYAFLGTGIFLDDKRLFIMLFATLIELSIEATTAYICYLIKES